MCMPTCGGCLGCETPKICVCVCVPVMRTNRNGVDSWGLVRLACTIPAAERIVRVRVRTSHADGMPCVCLLVETGSDVNIDSLLLSVSHAA